MELLTREEEKRFPREREILTAESSEGTEDDARPPSIPTHTTARGLVQVDGVQRREKPERRLAKKRKVVSDDEEGLAHEVRRVEMGFEGARQSRTRARPKKRANRRLVTAEVSDSSVEKTVAPIVNTSDAGVAEATWPMERGGPSGVSIKVSAASPEEPLKEKKELVVTQIGGTVVEAEGITLPTSPVEGVRSEVEKKASCEDVTTLEVAFPDFLQDSVVPLLKFLDGKRVKYVVLKEQGFYVQMIRNMTKLKRAVARNLWWTSYLE
ncbi:hypothetical protein AXG93_1856s1000 [Marchantia polymorpha subsp. ruderalis]|uniref:Uncharacterized protein n=1 Tax=Marchantia polymorpha subsp. ruderalis TaxID=1480154 RepID=A0A176VQC5_MARPO|nr:hypothetical protein AXG93_1856s1000 [Marchantia polymorpha subsp. ruderalis]